MRVRRYLALAAAAATLGAAAPTAESVLPWIKDDYARALSEARSTKRPIFVEAWAPW